MMDVKKPVTTGNIGASPLIRQPRQIAPQQVDDLLIQWLRQMRQMRQPVPTVQVSAPAADLPVQSEPIAKHAKLPERRWFTAQNSPANLSAAPKPLPAGRRKPSSSWAQEFGLLPLLMPQVMRRMRQALWRETQRVSRLTMARWRQHQYHRREGGRRG